MQVLVISVKVFLQLTHRLVLPQNIGQPASMEINLNSLTQPLHRYFEPKSFNLSICTHAQVAKVVETLGPPKGPPFDTKSSYPEMCLEVI